MKKSISALTALLLITSPVPSFALPPDEAETNHGKTSNDEFIELLAEMGKRNWEREGRLYLKAQKLYQQAMIQGSAKAQYELGKMYQKGGGVPKSLSQAVELYKKSAAQGYAEAQESLGDIYSSKENEIYVKQNYPEALYWYQKAAAQNLPGAQFRLGVLYDMGWGVLQNKDEAFKWYQKSALQGNAQAQYNLGKMFYENGSGIPQNYSEALKWFQKSANQGIAESQYALGLMYYRGLGISKNPNMAKDLFYKSCLSGRFRELPRFVQGCSLHARVARELKKAQDAP